MSARVVSPSPFHRVSAVLLLVAGTTTAPAQTEPPALPNDEHDVLLDSEPEEDLEFGGRVFSYARVSTSDPADDPLQQVSSSVWLQAHPRLGSSTYAHVVGSVDALATSMLIDDSVRATLREGYVGATGHGLEVRFGQQIVPWGNASSFNPTDLIGSADHTFFASDTEVRRVGTPMLWTSYTFLDGASPFSFTGVVVPVFASTRPLVPKDLVPEGVIDEGLVRPEPSVAHAEVAGRVRYAGAMWDAAVMGFHGWNHVPEYELRSIGATGVTVRRRHRAIDAVGLEASASVDAWVFRVESAYVWTDNPSGTNPERQPSHWDTVVGVERPFFDRLRAQAEVVFRYHPTLRPLEDVVGADPIETFVRREMRKVNALLLSYRYQSWPLGALRLAYATEDDRFEAELFGAVQLVREQGEDLDFFLRPQVTWSVSDALRWRLGAELFEGSAGGFFGSLHTFSGAYTEGEFVF
jgi:hypothetical protein